MLYTRKGDDGTTKTLTSTERFSKSSKVTEALGTLDELNSFVGVCKAKAQDFLFLIDDQKINLAHILEDVQEKLFIIQAEIAGSQMNIKEENIKKMEVLIDSIEKKLPKIKSFFIPGGDELSAMLDLSRTITRRAERTVIGAREENMINISPISLSYINRLSSLFYALARIVNYEKGLVERAPQYL